MRSASAGRRRGTRSTEHLGPSGREAGDSVDGPAATFIDDLASPRLPVAFRVADRLATPLARWKARLDPDELLEAATRKEGLADYGDGGFQEPFRVLVGALHTEAGLRPIGRFMVRQLLLQLLATRLRTTDLRTRYPAIAEEVVRAPIVVYGLPRTGTSHLLDLLAADPALRCLPYWESLEPVLPTSDGRHHGERPDPRIRRAELALRFINWVMPRFAALHEMTAEGPHEEIQLLAVEFQTMLFEASYDVPSYRDWYLDHDQTPAYLGLHELLRVLQWARGGSRWVLKSPQHLEQLPALVAAFPDAVLVQTHRDPVAVTASMCTLGAYTRRMQHKQVDLRTVGTDWARRVEQLLRASIDDRTPAIEDKIIDVRFHDYMGHELETVERIYEFAGQPFDPASRAAVARAQDERPRGRHGQVRHRLADFHIDPAERRQALAFYQQRFDLPSEDVI